MHPSNDQQKVLAKLRIPIASTGDGRSHGRDVGTRKRLAAWRVTADFVEGRPFIDIHRHYLNVDHDGDDGRPALSCLTFLAPWTVSDDSLAQTPDESQQTEDDVHKEIARLEAQLRSYVPISPKKSTKWQLGNLPTRPTPSPSE